MAGNASVLLEKRKKEGKKERKKEGKKERERKKTTREQENG